MNASRNSRWMRWVTEQSADTRQTLPWRRGLRIRYDLSDGAQAR